MRARFDVVDDDGRTHHTLTGHLVGHEMRLQLDHEHEEHEAGRAPSGRELKVVLRENGDVELTLHGGAGDEGRGDAAVVPGGYANQVRLRLVPHPTEMREVTP